MHEDGWNYNDSIDELHKLIKDNQKVLKYQAADLRDIFKLTKENYSMRLVRESLEDGSGDKSIKLDDLKSGFEILTLNREK